MFYRIVIIVILLAAAIGGYRLWSVLGYYHDMRSPGADFMVREATEKSPVIIVEFMNYGCAACQRTHRLLLEYATKNGDVTLVTRPIPQEPMHASLAAEMALAAGLQGKFWDLDLALSEYEGIFDDAFYKDAAAVYDIDYERLVKDATSDEVHDLAAGNLRSALRAGLESTPALMVGKTFYQLDGVLTVPELIRMIGAEKGDGRETP